jgi:chromosome segregation and condensation protein ScpB
MIYKLELLSQSERRLRELFLWFPNEPLSAERIAAVLGRQAIENPAHAVRDAIANVAESVGRLGYLTHRDGQGYVFIAHAPKRRAA